MKLKSILLSLLLVPTALFAATNAFDNVKVNQSILFLGGTPGAGKFITGDALGFMSWTTVVPGLTNVVSVGNEAVNNTISIANQTATSTWTNKVLTVTATNNFSLNRAQFKQANITLTNNITLQMATGAQECDVTLYNFKAGNLTNVVSLGANMIYPTNGVSWSFPLTIQTNNIAHVLTIKQGAYSHVLSVTVAYTNGW